MKFKIGDRVFHIQHPGGDGVDGHKFGTVIEYNEVQGGHYGQSNFPYVVRFDNGFTEVYRDEELCHEKDAPKNA